jgi:hypothetical protein
MEHMSRFLITILVLMSMPATGSADQIEVPDRIGVMQLGMTLDEAKSVFPDLPIEEASAANTNPPPPFAFAEAKLTGQGFGDLQPCAVTLRFFERRLIAYICECTDKGAAEAYLLNTYGPPGSKGPGGWQWPGTVRSMTYAPATGAITVSDNRANAAFALRVLFLAGRAQQGSAASPPHERGAH